MKVDFTGFSEFQHVTKDKTKVQKIMKSLKKDQSVRKENKVRMMTQSKEVHFSKESLEKENAAILSKAGEPKKKDKNIYWT